MSAKYASRYEAVFLCTHPKGPKMSQSAAAKYMRMSKAFVKWIQRYSVAKNVDDLPERGLIGKLDKRDEKIIVNLFSRNPALTLRQGQAKLKSKGLDISYETIRTHLRTHDLKWRNTMKKPLLTEKHVTKRLAWAHENIDRDFSNVIFTDECSIWARCILTRASWSTSTNRLVQRTLKHGVKVHLCGCFSKQGFGTLHLFTYNLNAEKMLKIYKKALLPSAERWFIDKNEDWILQEDNDPKHRSKLCTEWKKQSGIVTLDWPSQSPDANPIENVGIH
ncbi:transposable element tcb1 transposase [Lasius niger]|uniref:Transposable element tcb1 transposase n=1 Tax=Lasius niger TaxID=67767 RepID=A0A0J7KBQ7_LASNI|nr:transposable element tcb1 transposase [Lasius niger]